MKKFRKGFTLVELLIVIGVIGILGAMGMVGGNEATNIANATKIVEEFKIVGAAMNMYYADDKATCEAATVAELPGKIKTGITPYMKSMTSIIDTSGESNVGKYLISVHTDKTWWLTYTLPGDDTKVGSILKNKAEQEGFTKAITSTTNDYDGKATVCMKVR